MSPDRWPTPEEVEARLAQVAALNRLCASLAEAGRALRAAREAPEPEPQTTTPSSR